MNRQNVTICLPRLIIIIFTNFTKIHHNRLANGFTTSSLSQVYVLLRSGPMYFRSVVNECRCQWYWRILSYIAQPFLELTGFSTRDLTLTRGLTANNQTESISPRILLEHILSAGHLSPYQIIFLVSLHGKNRFRWGWSLSSSTWGWQILNGLAWIYHL